MIKCTLKWQIILDYQAGPSLITGVLRNGECFPAVVRRNSGDGGRIGESPACYLCRGRRRSMNQEHGHPLDAGEGKEMDFPTAAPERS